MLVPRSAGGETAVVMDFGLAKDKSTGPAAQKLTATGIVLGTPEFMSPEQVRGKELDPRSDVYATAIMAFELFTGELPFQGRTAQEMMVARLKGSPTPLRRYRPDLPGRLEKVLFKAMEPSADDRYPTAMALGEALLETVDGDIVQRLRIKLR
jgi:serine/threonine-protein kinase